jgi:hypothetical protein
LPAVFLSAVPILLKFTPMRDRGRLTAPGGLLDGAVLAPEPETVVPPSPDLATIAAEYGLRPSSVRPPRSRSPTLTTGTCSPVLPFACLAANFAFAPERVEVTREVGPAEGTGEIGPAQAEPVLQPGRILDSG